MENRLSVRRSGSKQRKKLNTDALTSLTATLAYEASRRLSSSKTVADYLLGQPIATLVDFDGLRPILYVI